MNAQVVSNARVAYEKALKSIPTGWKAMFMEIGVNLSSFFGAFRRSRFQLLHSTPPPGFHVPLFQLAAVGKEGEGGPKIQLRTSTAPSSSRP